MQSLLEIKDFLEFEDLFKKLKEDIFDKKMRGKPISEDLVTSFQKLYTTIDKLLARVGRRLVTVPQGGLSSLDHENLQSLCTKMMTLFESQFVGGDEDKPARLYEFLD